MDDEHSIQGEITHDAQQSYALISALKVLQVNFECMMGSGLLFTIQKLNGTLITDTFCVDGEDMEMIKRPIIDSLIRTLKRKKDAKTVELRKIEEAIKKYG